MAVLPLSPGAPPTTKIPVGSPVFATLDNEGYFARRRGHTLLPSPGSENYRFLLYRMRLQQAVKSLSGDFTLQASQILPQLYISDLYTATSPQTLDDLGITHILSLKSRFTILPFSSRCVSPYASPEFDPSRLWAPTPSPCSSASSASPPPLPTTPPPTPPISSSSSNPKSRFRAISLMLEDGNDSSSSSVSSTRRTPASTRAQPMNDLLSILPITTRFIQEALARKDAVNSRVLVHCDVGKSVSAAVVLGYLIRVHFHSYEKALEFLKSRRKLAEPHPSFVRQLKEWEQRVRVELELALENGLRHRVEEQQGRCDTWNVVRSKEDKHRMSTEPPTLRSTPPSSSPPASLEPG